MAPSSHRYPQSLQLTNYAKSTISHPELSLIWQSFCHSPKWSGSPPLVNSFIPNFQTDPCPILSCICVLCNHIMMFFHHLCAVGLFIIFLLSNHGAFAKGPYTSMKNLFSPKGLGLCCPISSGNLFGNLRFKMLTFGYYLLVYIKCNVGFSYPHFWFAIHTFIRKMALSTAEEILLHLPPQGILG